MITKIWVVTERPTPPEEPQLVGASNDEDYIDTMITALRSVATDETYWKEALDFMQL